MNNIRSKDFLWFYIYIYIHTHSLENRICSKSSRKSTNNSFNRITKNQFTRLTSSTRMADATKHVRGKTKLDQPGSRMICASDRNRGSAHERFRLWDFILWTCNLRNWRGNLFTGNCDTIGPAQLVRNWLESVAFNRATRCIEKAVLRRLARVLKYAAIFDVRCT